MWQLRLGEATVGVHREADVADAPSDRNLIK